MRRIRKHMRNLMIAATLAGGLVMAVPTTQALTINGDPSEWNYHGSLKEAICDFFGLYCEQL